MKANVLFLVPSLRRAGAETQLVELLNGLPDDKYEKHLFTFDPGLDLKERLRPGAIHFHHHARHGRLDLRLIRAIARLIDEQRIDLVHCTLEYSLFNAWLSTLLSRRRPALIYAVHSTLSRDLKSAMQERLIYRHLMRACRRLIFVCENQKQYWLGGSPSLAPLAEVIHNGVDPAWFEPDDRRDSRAAFRRQHSLPEEALVMCCIAGFRPEKGHLYLLEAFRTVADRLGDVYLLLAGDGPERGRIEEYIRRQRLETCVRLLGNVSDVRPLLSASEFSIIASTSVETFSMAMLESLSMQVPMVATDIGGASEAILPEETGLLVPPGDVPGLAVAMSRLATDAALRRNMGKNGRELVVRRFTRQQMIDRTGRLLDEVINDVRPVQSNQNEKMRN